MLCVASQHLFPVLRFRTGFRLLAESRPVLSRFIPVPEMPRGKDKNPKKVSNSASVKRKAEDKPEPAAKKPLMNKSQTDYESIDFTSDAKTKDGKAWDLKIASWNVDGLRAWVKKGGAEYIEHEEPHIICLQETKCGETKLPDEVMESIEGYHPTWLAGTQEGYAGVALLSKEKPIKVKTGLDNPDFDSEGRLIHAEFDKFHLVTVYVPNAGRNLVTLPKRMEWDPILCNFLKDLDAEKPVILCGDLNVAHEEIDLANPKTNKKNAGFTKEERDGFSSLLSEGFQDSFRSLYPDKKDAYTFWTYMSNSRSRNIGWRLDYFVLSERLIPSVADVIIRDEVYGSDHCPLVLLLNTKG